MIETKVTPIKRENMVRETKRAANYFVAQIKKGWTPEESMEQVENSYGEFISYCLLYSLKNLEYAPRIRGNKQ